MENDNKNKLLPRIGEKVKKIKEVKISNTFKKQLVITLSMALIGGAVLVNWTFFSDQKLKDTGNNSDADISSAEDASVDEDFFAATQISRQRARDESIEVLQTIVDNEEALDEVKTEAWNDITQIAQNIEAEANIESLVMSRGIAECVAVVSNDNATVIVKTDGLHENQITQIQEIVYEQTNIPVENLKIIEK